MKPEKKRYEVFAVKVPDMKIRKVFDTDDAFRAYHEKDQLTKTREYDEWYMISDVNRADGWTYTGYIVIKDSSKKFLHVIRYPYASDDLDKAFRRIKVALKYVESVTVDKIEVKSLSMFDEVLWNASTEYKYIGFNSGGSGENKNENNKAADVGGNVVPIHP